MTHTERVLDRFAALVRTRREARQMGQNELARRAHLHPPQLSDVLGGRRWAHDGPTLRTLVRIAEGLGCELVIELRERGRR